MSLSSHRRDPTRLGSVQDVAGHTVRVELDEATISGLAFIDGYAYRIGQIGSFVRIPLGYVDLFGVISQVGAGSVPESLQKIHPHGNRWITVQLVGEGTKTSGFQRGLSQYPTVSDAVHLVTQGDLVKIYGHASSSNYVRIGTLASAESIPAVVNVDKLITRHSAVLGTTGAGKSTTVAGLIRVLSDEQRYPSARILVIDIHGEYSRALADRASVFRINANSKRNEQKLFVPYWAMSFDELLPLTFGSLDDPARGAILQKVTDLKLEALRPNHRGVTADNLTVDTPVPFSIHKLWFDLHRLVNATHTAQQNAQSDSTVALLVDAGNKPVQLGDALRVIPPRYQALSQGRVFLSASTLNIRRQLEFLASRLRDPRYDFLFRPGPWLPNELGETLLDLDRLLEGWIGSEKPVTILDLSGVPVSILNHLIGSLLRTIYDALVWGREVSEGARQRPLLVVLEEAHTYLRPGDNSSASSAVRRIAKEGRKYGIGAMIVSQRPAEVDETVLSQCGTLFAMRLANATDRAHVKGAVTDNLEGLLGMLPTLRTGEAIVMGEAVNLPVRALIDAPLPHQRPDSSDPLIVSELDAGGWDKSRAPSDYKELVELWRKQAPRSPRVVSDE